MARFGYVLDASTSRVTREDFRRLRDMGFEGFIQCLQTGGFSSSQEAVRAVAEPNMSDGDAEGYAVGGYLNSQPWRPAQVIHDDAKSVAGAAWSGLQMVANDVEISDPSLPYPHVTEAQAHAAHSLIVGDGKRTLVYSAWWYASKLPNAMRGWLWIPAKWDADYDGSPGGFDVHWGPDVPIVGKQYAGTTPLGDDLFDLNFFDIDYLKAPVAPPVVEDILAELSDKEQRDLYNWVKELKMRLDGYKIEASQLTAEHHLGPEDAKYVGVPSFVEILHRMRDVDHGV